MRSLIVTALKETGIYYKMMQLFEMVWVTKAKVGDN